MKKIFTLLLVLAMVFGLAACGLPDIEDIKEGVGTYLTTETDPTTVSQSETEAESTPGEAVPEETEGEASADVSVSDKGLPVGWVENEYTKLVPAPDCGGKVISANEIGELFAIDLEWEMAQGLAYAKLLQDAGFGEDCVEKYEQYGYIDRTYNGVNVQLMDLFGTTSLCIMPVEAE